MGFGNIGVKSIGSRRSNWIRLPNGSTPPPTPTPPTSTALLEFEGINNSTSIVDSTGLNTWTNNGGCTISTAQFNNGASSLLLNGSGSVSSPNTSNLTFPNDFEWTGWIRPTIVTGGIFMAICGNAAGGSSGNAGIFVSINNGSLVLRHWVNGNSNASISGVVVNQWQFFKATRVGNVLDIYLDNVKGTSGSTSGSAPANQFTIGFVPVNAGFANAYQGYLDTLVLKKL